MKVIEIKKKLSKTSIHVYLLSVAVASNTRNRLDVSRLGYRRLSGKQLCCSCLSSAHQNTLSTLMLWRVIWWPAWNCLPD